MPVATGVRGWAFLSGPLLRDPRRSWAVVAAALCLAPPVASAQSVPSDIQWPPSSVSAARTISLLAQPTLTLGSASGPDHLLLSGVVGVALLSDGGVAIADGSSQRIVFFDAGGQFQRAVGRLGDGPGEFRFLRWFGRCGGGVLAAYDGAPPSLTTMSEEGEFSHRSLLPASLSFQTPIACRGPDRILFLLQGPSVASPPGRFVIAPTAVIRLDDRRRVDTLAVGVGQVYYFATRTPDAYADVPLRPTTLAAAGPSRLFVIESALDTIRVLNAATDSTTTITLGLRRLPMTRSHWERGVRDRRAREPLERTRRILDGVLGELGPARELPLVAELVADASDLLWVKTFDNYLTPFAVWLIVAPDGRVLARAVAPAALRPLEIGRDYLIGVSYDADGVETVVLHKFRPISGGR